MTAAILISQCLQNDFVKPLGPHDPLPNGLHVGHAEAHRLLGNEPSSGPVVRFMRWAHEHMAKGLSVIHVRDWHDHSDPLQHDHLQQFGPHCLAHSDGARFVFESETAPQAHIVNATTLNDFQDTTLAEHLSQAAKGGQRVKVGIVGVWTEAKVSFLAYELRTRYPTFDLGVCSALCASSSRAEHYHALEQLSRILGVALFSSVGEFSDWLIADRLELPLPGVSETRPRLVMRAGASEENPLNKEEQQLVRYLFRDCQRVDLEMLGGGFSGNRVLGATGTDREGHEQVPHVVKIGAQESIGRERAHFERIESVLGNAAPQIADFADFGQKGALKYRYAAMGGGFSSTFQKQYQKGLALEDIERVLKTVFEEQLGRLYAAARRERCNLLAHYGFDPKWADSVRAKVQALIGSAPESATLAFPLASTADQQGDPQGPTLSLYNLHRFYTERLLSLPKDERESAYFAYVHGDLNGANIVIDRQQNVWIIDYFHTRRAHVLMDLIKLENDLLYIMTPLPDDAALASALRFSDTLFAVSDLAAELPEQPPVSGAEFARVWATLRLLRGFYPGLIHSDRSPLQLLVGQLRYAVHTLGFDECSPLQKRWALYSACLAAQKIDEYYVSRERLRVDWLPSEYTRAGRVGLTILPGRRDMGRDLARDLDVLEFEGTTHVLCLLSDDELATYGVPQAIDAFQQRGFDVHQLPILDQSVCTLLEMQCAVQFMQAAVSNAGVVVIHCVGGLGRSGIAAAAFLKQLGLGTDEAIRVVRKVRSARAVETEIQEEFVAEYAADLQPLG